MWVFLNVEVAGSFREGKVLDELPGVALDMWELLPVKSIRTVHFQAQNGEFVDALQTRVLC